MPGQSRLKLSNHLDFSAHTFSWKFSNHQRWLIQSTGKAKKYGICRADEIKTPTRMKKMISKMEMTYQQKLDQERSKGTRYGLRTEYRGDCESIFIVLKPWLLSWKEASGWELDDSHVDSHGRHWASKNWGVDTDVEFILKEKGPILNEIRWLINTIVDRHVPAQTVALLVDFTGERIDHDVLDEIAIPPSNEIVEAAIQSIEEQKECLEIRADACQETIERLNAQLGDEEPYKRRVAKRTAEFLMESFIENTEKVDPIKLAEVIYQKMTFDKSGAHSSFSN